MRLKGPTADCIMGRVPSLMSGSGELPKGFPIYEYLEWLFLTLLHVYFSVEMVQNSILMSEKCPCCVNSTMF